MSFGKKQRPILKILETMLSGTSSEHEKERILKNLPLVAKKTLEFEPANWEGFYKSIRARDILLGQNEEEVDSKGEEIYTRLKIGVTLPTPNSSSYRLKIYGAMHAEYRILRSFAENGPE